MHEFSIAMSLLQRVEVAARERRAVSVQRIKLRVGALSGVEIPLLETAFELARYATLAGEAELECVAVPAVWACGECGHDLERAEILRCRTCGQPATLREGGEIFLESLEMEVP